jgi:hypothetical protein
MTEDVVPKEELRSAIAARKELGDEMEPAVIDAFVARLRGARRHRDRHSPLARLGVSRTREGQATATRTAIHA